jgi:hypothetical protein
VSLPVLWVVCQVSEASLEVEHKAYLSLQLGARQLVSSSQVRFIALTQ